MQPAAPLVLIIRHPPHPRAQVRRGSALITILHFTLKEHLKRLWWGTEKSTCLQNYQEGSKWGRAALSVFGFPSCYLPNCVPTSIKENLAPVFWGLNCWIVYSVTPVLMIMTPLRNSAT